jgi:uncharacterized protein YbaR (Trm112 family)
VIDKELLEILVCPDNKTSLQLAAEELVGRLNQAIAAGELKNLAGEPVKDGALLYPIVDGIPILLVDEAIPLEGIPQAAQAGERRDATGSEEEAPNE